MIAPISPRRLTKLSLECAIEGRFRLVSYIGGDVRDAPRCLFEGSCGNLKSLYTGQFVIVVRDRVSDLE